MQVKILVPNTTAGMIIGKGGSYIKQIKEQTGAYIQLSQKPKDVSLPERCITVSGNCTLEVFYSKYLLGLDLTPSPHRLFAWREDGENLQFGYYGYKCAVLQTRVS